MKSKLAEPLIGAFQMQSGFFAKALEGITDEHAVERNAHTNHIAWLAGHLVSCRHMLAGMIGVQADEPFPELFSNLKGISDTMPYPGLKELASGMPGINEMLIEQLSAMTDEDFYRPMGDSRLIDIVSFFAYHEGYHIGQISLLRRQLGYEPINHIS